MRCNLEEISVEGPFTSDVCVIGGGIAGIILAWKLASLGFDVHLLEAGGFEMEDRSQALYQARMLGHLHRGTREGRFRLFGGSSTHWAAQLLPYPEETFTVRAAVGQLGWPIGPSDLMRYYPEIDRIMGVNTLPFDASFRKEQDGTDDVRLRFSKWAPLGRKNLARTLGRECLASSRVTVFTHANAISIESNPDGLEANGVTVKNFGGRTFSFTARHYVVTTGTIETSRLLLNSKGIHSTGTGNSHDQLGRYFFDHVSCEVGRVGTLAYLPYCRHFAPYFQKNTLHTPRLETSAALQQKESILAVMAHFEFEEPEGSGLVLFRRFMHDLQQGRLGRGQKLSDLPHALVGGLRTAFDLKVRGRRIPSPEARISLRFDVEQKPDPESRLRLCEDDLDSLGMPRLSLDWRKSDDEFRSMYFFARPIDSYLRTHGLILDWKPHLEDGAENWRDLGIDIFHPMGGARMGFNPATSVVDPNLRVHGISNLFVASCAVYPTGGSSNPTFTLMALALRLAEYLAAHPLSVHSE